MTDTAGAAATTTRSTMKSASSNGIARRDSILVRDKSKKKDRRNVRFGPTEYSTEDEDPIHAEPEPVAVEKKIRLLQRTPTGRYHGRAPPKLHPHDGVGIGAAAGRKEPVKVAMVSQELQPHHTGPMFRVRACFYRDDNQPLGMSILSPEDGQRGSRIGAIEPNSAVTTCTEGSVLIDDRIVEICGIDICSKPHEEVVQLLRETTGSITLMLERSTYFRPRRVDSEFLVCQGTGPVPNKKKLGKKKTGKKGEKRNFFGKERRGSSRGRDSAISLKRADLITVHRHPNSNGLQIGIRGGVEDGSFPKILTAVHPRSPFAPLVEGGVLGNEYELLEINGDVALGMPHDDLISTLKDVGDDVQLLVIPPAMRNRQLAKLFANPADDEETALFMDRLRRAMYTRLMCVTTEPVGVDGKSLPGLTHITESKFADLASSDKLFEWAIHSNGYMYGLPRNARGRPAASAPFVLAKALDELYPVPDIPERVASPMRPLDGSPLKADVEYASPAESAAATSAASAAVAAAMAAASKATSPTKSVSPPASSSAATAAATRSSPTKAAQPAMSSPIPPGNHGASTAAGTNGTLTTTTATEEDGRGLMLVDVIDQMESLTNSLKARAQAREAAGETMVADGTDDDLAHAVASLQALHLSCAQALVDADDTHVNGRMFSVSDDYGGETATDTTPNGKRPVANGNGLSCESPPESGPTEARIETLTKGLKLPQLLDLVRERTEAIESVATDKPVVSQHCRVIFSALETTTVLLESTSLDADTHANHHLNGELKYPTTSAEQEGRDSGMATEGEGESSSPEASTSLAASSPSLDVRRTKLAVMRKSVV
eukprot:m.23293 g.23293  ORF g.23293 m.23293 type:complete len:833 (-) comp4068_c0_seq1:1028-3526(-)